EMTLSDEILKRNTEAYRRIRNTARFLLANLGDFDPTKDVVAPQDMLALDRWAVDQAYQSQQRIISAYDRYQFHLVSQEIQRFCAVEMSSLFLHVTKDRQYTMQANSLGRRSAQTAAWHILRAMLRWMCPILSFTAEEVLKYLPGETEEYVLFMQWYDGLFPLDVNEKISAADWEHIFAAREAVSKQLENLRIAGHIGSSLEAEVDLYCAADSEQGKALAKLEDEVKFVFITSAARLHFGVAPANAEKLLEGLQGVATVSEAAKCTRCWHHVADVGTDASHPELCGRCIKNVVGAGEHREYA
ncbi:MAG TPA: class I tRNA ligase family protein, partial [Thiolinea sp.]|nr:class I tRNA ligase family protein [Thiolinea sp.]